MNERQDEMYQAASMYYVQGDTMENIAGRLGVSRSTVSRLLAEARENGMVRITLTEPVQPHSAVTSALEKLFGVRAHVVSLKEGMSDVATLDRVARVAAGLVTDMLQPGNVVGVAWGTTAAAIAQHLPRRPTSDVTVVQLNGAANARTSGLPYVGAIMQQMADAWQAGVESFPVPAFFDDPRTKQLLWRERAIARVLQIQARTDIAIFGVGSSSARVASHVYAANYLDEADFAQMAEQHVVGDVCTVFLRQDGTWRDVELNSRVSGPTPDQLQHIPRRVCVVASADKAPALLGALRARTATDLVVDDHTARAVLALVHSGR